MEINVDTDTIAKMHIKSMSNRCGIGYFIIGLSLIIFIISNIIKYMFSFESRIFDFEKVIWYYNNGYNSKLDIIIFASFLFLIIGIATVIFYNLMLNDLLNLKKLRKGL